MKLLRVQIEGCYKSLADQIFDFSQAGGNVYVLVGLNGSGKSQLMELIAECFTYIERERRADFKTRKRFPFTTHIEFQHAEGDIRPITYKISIGNNGIIKCWILEHGVFVVHDLHETPIPRRIVGYASGGNENLQRPFLKNTLQYFDIIRIRRNHQRAFDRASAQQFQEIKRRYKQRFPHIFEDLENSERLIEAPTELPIGIFIDYDCSTLLAASLAVLPEVELNSIFALFRFNKISRLRISYDMRRTLIEDDTINDIKQILAIEGVKLEPASRRSSDKEYEQYELEYLSGTIEIDLNIDALRAKFQSEYYSIPETLFYKLYKPQILSAGKLTIANQKLLRNDAFFGSVKKPVKTRQAIEVSSLMLTDGNTEIDFNDLSDGEHQLLQILSATKVFRDPKTLHLWDEPETHLNPSWRTNFHKLVTDIEVRASQGHAKAQYVISAHSAFLVSSVTRDCVFLFSKADGKTLMDAPADQTYGASYEFLTKYFFGLQSMISQTAVDEIRSQLDRGDDQASFRWISEHIGQSMEKAYLLRKLSQ